MIAMPSRLLAVALVLSVVTAQSPAPQAPGLEIVVRTRDGKPVGNAPVGLGVAPGSLTLGPKPLRTDRDGRVRVEVDRKFGMQVFVGVVGSFTTPCEQKVDLRQPHTEPIVLTVPPCGQVRFILYGPDEKPASGLGVASLRLVDGRVAGRAAAVRESMTMTTPPTEHATDNLMFDCVEIGHDVAVTVEVAGMAKPLVFHGKGPTRQGELVVVDGRLSVGPPILSFRIVDQQGQPVVKERVGLGVRSENQWRTSDAVTDADGRIVLPLASVEEKDLWVLRRRASASTEYCGAVHKVLGSVTPGQQELGDLRLVDEPVVARGRLVDGDQQPIAGVWLKAQASFQHGSGGGSYAGGFWFFEHRVRTAADGTFEVREVDPLPVSWLLQVEDGKWIAAGGLELQSGQPDVQDLRLWRSSTIAAQFAGSELAEIMVDARLVHRETGLEVLSRFANGVLQPVTSAAGSYDLQIGPKELGFRIEGIQAPADGKASDERLRAIALPEGLLIVRATVVDEAGQPVPAATVWCDLLQPGVGSSSHGMLTGEDGRVTFLAKRKDCGIAIRGGGFATQRIAEVTPELRICVTRIAPVQVRVQGLPELLPDVRIRIACTRGVGTRPLLAELHGDSATLQFEEPGRWNLRLMLSFLPGKETSRQAQHEIAILLGSADIRFEIEATGLPADPKDLVLTKEQRDDLVERIQAAKDILAEQKGK